MTKHADRHQIDLTTEVMEIFTNGGQVLVCHMIMDMLKHGLMQSDRIIMEKVDLTDNYIRARIKGKKQEGKVAEVWIRDGENLKLVYKKTNDQPI